MKILAIDDNQDNLTTLHAVLADGLPGATLLTALNGLEGIEIALIKDPDVILLDILMPVMNGFEVCKKLKLDDRLREIPVLFLTAQSTDRDSRLTAMEVGAEGFLSKPFDEVELIIQIRAMAKIKSANRLRCMEKAQLAELVQERTRELEHELEEHKRTEKTLRAVSARQEAILAAVPDIIMEVDNNKVYTWANQGGLAFFGGDVVGKEAADYFEGKQQTYQVVQPLFDGQQDLIYVESWQRRHDGTKRLLAWWCRVLRDERGDVTGALSSGRDITEIKRAEEELRESETKFKAMVETFPLAIHLSVGHEQITQYINPTMVKLFGYTMEDLPSVEQWWPLAYPDKTYRKQISEEWNRRVKLAIETQSPVEPMEVVVTCRDGSKKHISWGFTTLGDRNYSYGIDLTERKHAQEEREISQRMLSSMINAITESAFLMTLDGTVLIANEAVAHRLGKSSNRLRGMNIYDLIPPELARTRRLQAEHSIRSRAPLHFEDIRLGRHILNSIYPVMDANGEVLQLAVFGYDITERKHAEESVQKSEAQLRAILDATPFPIAIVDVEDNNIVFWSRSALTLFGHTAPTASQWYQKAYPDPDYERDVIERWKPALELARRSKGAVNTGEYRVTCRDGSVRTCEIYAAFLEDFLIVTFNDITERVRTEEDKREEQILLKTMIDSLPGAFYMLDENGCYVRWNAYQRDEIVGKPENQVAGTPAIVTIHPDDRALVGSKIESVLHGAAEVVAGRVLLRGGPDYRWLLMTGRRINYKGKPFLVGMGIDLTDQRKAEDALRESEERFRNVFEHAAVGKSITNVNGQLKTNKAFCHILGYSTEELSAARWQDITHPDDVERDQKLIDSIVSGKNQSQRWEKRYIHKNGHVVWVDISTVLQKDPDNKPHFFITTIFDITERRRIEEALRESERKFRETIVNLDEGYYCVTLDGILLEHNVAFSRMLGYDEKLDLKGMDLREIWLDPDRRPDYVRILVETGFISHYQIDAKTRTGEKITVLVSAHIVKDRGNAPIWIEGVLLDITIRMQAEEEITTLNDRLQHLIGALKDLSSAHTIENVQHIVSTSARRLTNADGATMVLRDGDYCHYADENTIEPHLKGQIHHLTHCISGWVMLHNAPAVIPDVLSDDRIPVEIDQATSVKSLVMIPVTTTEPVAAIGSYWNQPHHPPEIEIQLLQTLADSVARAVENVQLMSKLEQRVAERTGQLEAANKELEAFAYSVSHDLRAPLRAVDGYTRMLIEDYEPHLDAEGKRICSVISESARDMGKLIDDLLSFSRIGRSAMKVSPIDMTTLANSMFFELTTFEERNRIDFIVHPLPAAVADPILIRLVWMNLIGNAVKFSSKAERAMIVVSSDSKDGEVVYSIRDNGAGFDMQYVGKLFGVFQRLHTAKEFEGTGVGLAIVQRIILRHGGRVWAKGDVGHGAEFCFIIPRGCDDGARNTKDESSKSANSPSNE